MQWTPRFKEDTYSSKEIEHFHKPFCSELLVDVERDSSEDEEISSRWISTHFMFNYDENGNDCRVHMGFHSRNRCRVVVLVVMAYFLVVHRLKT